MGKNNKQAHSRYAIARKLLLGWCLFIGLGAVAGAVGMLSDPSGKAMGMDAMLPYFQALPFADVVFQDFRFSGWALLIVNGLSNLTAAGLLIAGKRSGVALGGAFGVTLMLWICIQFYMFPLNFMSTSYFIFGLAQAATGWAAWVFNKQERFSEEASHLSKRDVGSKRLVVYFSRLGYVKRLAYEAANSSGADVYEVIARERTRGTVGFWWCGRYAMHRWDMPIEEITVDLTKYDHVTICAPVWVFSLASPMRAFCRAARGKIAESDYILCHHTRGVYKNVADEMDGLIGVKAREVLSVCCQAGEYKSRKKLPSRNFSAM